MVAGSKARTLSLAAYLSALSFVAACESPSEGSADAQQGTAGTAELAGGGAAADSGADSGAGGASAGAPDNEAVDSENPLLDGPVRFSVLSPGVIRLEYADNRKFNDSNTFNVVGRDLAKAGFSSVVRDGWREIRTAQVKLRYRRNSGPFSRDNLQVVLAGQAAPVASPHFRGAACTSGELCEAEDARLSGSLRVVQNHSGYSGNGFVDQWFAGSGATWLVSGVPGAARVRIRYANGGTAASALAWEVWPGGSGSVMLPTTSSWDAWNVVDIPFSPQTPNFALSLSCPTGSACSANVDAIAITAADASFPQGNPVQLPLGGWKRSFDDTTADLQLDAGLLSRDGWSMLDDSNTALWDGHTQPRARPTTDKLYQDEYLFAYDHDYRGALAALTQLTGSPPLLPRYAFGVAFSRFFAYHDTDWEFDVVPAFRAHQTPLDLIGLDTDWKAPTTWDGWDWSTVYFPDPAGFAAWAGTQNLHVLLNIHPGIETTDPHYAATLKTAGTLVDTGTATTKSFDLGSPAQVMAFSALHQPLLKLGMIPWFDCDQDTFPNSVLGLTTDSWVNSLYAQWPEANGARGFAWSRAGGAPGTSETLAGPWAEHRSTVQFTGDTSGEWWQLALEAQFTSSEASIGLPYITHDIGSFRAQHPADDLYARWVQFGTFQPILRFHSDHGDRLPWNFGAEAEASAIAFLQLREAMLPYNYTLGWVAHTTGLSMARPLWLDYAELDEAYAHPTEYLWGDSLLVAPVVNPGSPQTSSVWLPPGVWCTLSEAGLAPATFTGPGTFAITTTLASMPVFAKAGSIVPMQSYADSAADTSVTLEPRVYGGADGEYTLYEDEGQGLGYRNGASATTEMTLTGREFAIAPRVGSYPNAPLSRRYRIVWSYLDAPKAVLVSGKPLPRAATGDDTWSYDVASRTLQVRLAARPTNTALSVLAQ